MESQSILGFETASKYTGEGKGGPDPQGRKLVFQTSLPPFLILISPILPPHSKESLDIHIILTGNEETPN